MIIHEIQLKCMRDLAFLNHYRAACQSERQKLAGAFLLLSDRYRELWEFVLFDKSLLLIQHRVIDHKRQLCGTCKFKLCAICVIWCGALSYVARSDTLKNTHSKACQLLCRYNALSVVRLTGKTTSSLVITVKTALNEYFACKNRRNLTRFICR